MESTVFGDKLVSHGEKTNARCYREERSALIESTHVSFFFLTKVYDDYVKEVMKKITMKSKPDVIIVNSCLWDITRWGCDGVKHFKENLKSLLKKFKMLFSDCLVIWVTTPPIACELKGGFLVKELQFLKYSLRFHIVEANHYARKVVVENGFDVLDTHYHLHMQIHRRCNDGIHWLPEAVRYVTNLLLRHISLAWDVALPHRYESVSVDKNLLSCIDVINPAIVEAAIEVKENLTDIVQICPEKSVTLSESNKNMVKTINKEKVTKEKHSVSLRKDPSNKESIYSHMAKNNKMARRKRIRKWNQHLIDNSQIVNSSISIWDHSVFNSNAQPYNTSSHLAHHNFPSNNNYMLNPNVQSYNASSHLPYHNFPSNNNNILFPSFNSYHPGSDIVSNGGSRFGNQSHFQSYGVPYVFPSVEPGQLLQPNLNFIPNDEIHSNFHF